MSGRIVRIMAMAFGSIIGGTFCYAQCGKGSDLAKTLASSMESHPERFEPYKFLGYSKEADHPSLQKYGPEIEKAKLPDHGSHAKACLTEFEFRFKSQQGETVTATCFVSARIKGNATVGYAINLCEKATSDQALAKLVDFRTID